MLSGYRYPNLYAPRQLRSSVARNRFVMPAMATHFAELDGSVSDSLCDYLEERARGGFGIVVTENIGVHASGRMMARMAMADDDRHLPGLSRLAKVIKCHGAIAIAQINHGGRQTKRRLTGQQLVAPSPIPCPLMQEIPRELGLDEIAMLQDAYADAALRLQEAGFDGTEIHAAHGYLAASFMSAYSNQRTDEFGGSLDNRLRFLTGIVERIRARARDNFLLFVRMSVEEFVPRGIDPEQTILIARQLAARGVDVLSLSVGVYESYNRLTMLSGEPEGPWLERASRVRRATTLPIVGVGRIKRPEAAEAAIAAGQVDFVAIGRGSITNPDFPRATQHSKGPGVVACMSCNICLGRGAAPVMTCPVNPFVGRERALRSVAEDDYRSIDIRGGGFAALTAAWLAARRGARVRLVARENELAGMQSWRGRVPGQAEYRNTCVALVERARTHGVEFVSPDAYDGSPDIVWDVRRWEPVAIPTKTDAPAVTSYEVLRGLRDPLSGRILVAGDDLSSVDAALFLAARGHPVTLRSPARDIGFDAHPGFRGLNKSMLTRRGARIEVEVPLDVLLDGRGFDALVIGRLGPTEEADLSGWRSDFGDAGSAEIDDAYEPGVLTRSVYAAVEFATLNKHAVPAGAGGHP